MFSVLCFPFEVKWENRNIGWQGGACRITIDGTDCRIQEPQPFSPTWYSHKFKGAGLRYEVGVAIATGWIVWVFGPFPCGACNNLGVARTMVQTMMETDKMYVGDKGYQDGGLFGYTPTGQHNYQQRVEGLARARHETVNGQLKKWNVLSNKFWHPLELHNMVFFGITNITQLSIEEDSPTFQVDCCM